jgi:hypothetical protein
MQNVVYITCFIHICYIQNLSRFISSNDILWIVINLKCSGSYSCSLQLVEKCSKIKLITVPLLKNHAIMIYGEEGPVILNLHFSMRWVVCFTCHLFDLSNLGIRSDVESRACLYIVKREKFLHLSGIKPVIRAHSQSLYWAILVFTQMLFTMLDMS